MNLKSQMFTKRPADVADVEKSIARIFMRVIIVEPKRSLMAEADVCRMAHRVSLWDCSTITSHSEPLSILEYMMTFGTGLNEWVDLFAKIQIQF